MLRAHETPVRGGRPDVVPAHIQRVYVSTGFHLNKSNLSPGAGQVVFDGVKSGHEFT